MDKLYDAWAKRNPNWEARFKEPVIERFANYGSGAGESVEMRGKSLGVVTRFSFWLFSSVFMQIGREVFQRILPLGITLDNLSCIGGMLGKKQVELIMEQLGITCSRH